MMKYPRQDGMHLVPFQRHGLIKTSNLEAAQSAQSTKVNLVLLLNPPSPSVPVGGARPVRLPQYGFEHALQRHKKNYH